jgi:uncharacterized protein YbaR (Trm112 family)
MTARIFGLFEDSYRVQCTRCGESLDISREEVEAGLYTCPACGAQSPIPDGVLVQYRANRLREEARNDEQDRKRQEQEWRTTERAEQDAAALKRRQERSLAQNKRRQARGRWRIEGTGGRPQASQVKLDAHRHQSTSRAESLRAGKCPACGAQLQVVQSGYDGGWGLLGLLASGSGLGLLAGFLGSGKKVRVCSGCGRNYRFAYSGCAKLAVIGLVVLILVILVSPAFFKEQNRNPVPHGAVIRPQRPVQAAAPAPAAQPAKQQFAPQPPPSPAVKAQLAKGMTENQVRQFLGYPSKQSSLAAPGYSSRRVDYWTYVSGQKLQFVNGKLESWGEPRPPQ